MTGPRQGVRSDVTPPGAVDRSFDGLVVRPASCRRSPQPNRFGRCRVQRPPSATAGESARARWPEGEVGRGLTGSLPGCPWRRRASPVRPVGTAPDDGEEPRTAKQMITAASGCGLPHRARRALPTLTSEDGLWPVGLANTHGRSLPVHVIGGAGKGGSPRIRSAGKRQSHQPFELADFLAKTAHAGAVDSLQPHGGGEIAMPGGPVPAFTIQRGVRY